MKYYAIAVAIILQFSGWIAVAVACFIVYRQSNATSGLIASYSGLGAFRPVVPAGIAAVGMLLLGLGVLLHLNARRN